MTAPRPAAVRLVVAIYAAILRLYPADFRRACGAAMLETFESLCRERAATRGPLRLFAGCIPDCADAITCAWRTRRARPGARRERIAAQESVPVTVGLWQDTHAAARRLRTQPGLAVFIVSTLGFAIAACSALFSLADAVLLRPSPFAGVDRLVGVMSVSPRGFTYPGLNADKLRLWRAETGIFEAIEMYRPAAVVVTGGPEPRQVAAAAISPGLLPMLGVTPRLGRTFVEADLAAGRPGVVLVSEGFWLRHLGGDAAAVGRRLTINGEAHDVIGVMPARFRFPSLREELWLPLDSATPGGAGTAIGRLAPDITIGAAHARVDGIVARLDEAQPIPSGWNIRLTGETFASPPEPLRRAVLVLFGAVMLLLLAAGANVANVLLSRAVERRREFAIRLALGARRVRVARELAIEGALLGLLSGALGLAAAHWAIDMLVRLAPADLAVATTVPIAVDGRVAGFGLLVACLSGVLCNLLPAWRLLRGANAGALSGRQSAGSASRGRARAALVVAEVGVSVVLLVGAALLARSMTKLNAIDVGFEPEGLLAVTIGLDTGRYANESSRAALLEEAARRIAARSDVSAVAVSSGLPPSAGDASLAHIETPSGACGDEPVGIVSNLVTPEYFSVTRLRLAAGRALGAGDPIDAVVVSSGMARHCGVESLVGARIRLGPAAPWLTVVGMTGDVKTLGLRSGRDDLAVYSALSAGTFLLPNVATRVGGERLVARRLIVRTSETATMTEAIKRAVWAIDPDQPVLAAATASDLMAETVRAERFVLRLLGLFSIVALALASAGLFGVLAYLVARRTREIGIRMALGASPGRVLALVVGEGMALAGAGVAAGLCGAFVLSRVLAGILYDVDPHDPMAFAGIAVLVSAVALAASVIPAARAFQIDPAVALRDE